MNKKETMLKIVCPYCGFYWWTNDLEKVSGTAMHQCSYCHRDYNIVANIQERREY